MPAGRRRSAPPRPRPSPTSSSSAPPPSTPRPRASPSPRGASSTTAEDVDGRQVVGAGPRRRRSALPAARAARAGGARSKDRPFTVVGVLERRGKVLGMFNLDNMVMMPDEHLPRRCYGKRRTVSLNVEARTPTASSKAMEEVTRVMRQRRNVAPHRREQLRGLHQRVDGQVAQRSVERRSPPPPSACACCRCSSAASASSTSCWCRSPSGRGRSACARRWAPGARRILLQFATEAVVLSLVGRAHRHRPRLRAGLPRPVDAGALRPRCRCGRWCCRWA